MGSQRVGHDLPSEQQGARNCFPEVPQASSQSLWQAQIVCSSLPWSTARGQQRSHVWFLRVKDPASLAKHVATRKVNMLVGLVRLVQGEDGAGVGSCSGDTGIIQVLGHGPSPDQILWSAPGSNRDDPLAGVGTWGLGGWQALESLEGCVPDTGREELVFKLLFSCSVVSNILRPHGPQPTRLLCPWDFPGKNTGVGSCSLLQEIFPTQRSNPGPLHCRQILYC